MNQVDFSNIELSFLQRLTLRYVIVFHSGKGMDFQTLDFLHRTGLIDRSYGDYLPNIYSRMYFRVKRKERLKFVVPTLISIIALFAGYDVYRIPLLDEVLSAVKMLLKYVLGSLGIFS